MGSPRNEARSKHNIFFPEHGNIIYIPHPSSGLVLAIHYSAFLRFAAESLPDRSYHLSYLPLVSQISVFFLYSVYLRNHAPKERRPSAQICQ